MRQDKVDDSAIEEEVQAYQNLYQVDAAVVL